MAGARWQRIRSQLDLFWRRRRLLRWGLLALAHKSKRFTTRKSPKDLIYTNVPDGLYHQFRVVSLTRSKSVSPSYLHIAYPTPDITKLLARAIHSSRSIPYGYLVFSLFRKQQQRNCRRRQVRRNIIHSQIVIPLKSFET